MPRDVAALTDEELTTLSLEMREAVGCFGWENNPAFADSEAEARYREIRLEVGRRFAAILADHNVQGRDPVLPPPGVTVWYGSVAGSDQPEAIEVALGAPLV